MKDENRILVNEGRVTIMINLRHPPTKAIELMLRGLCCVLEGADVGNDWDKFTDGMIELTKKLIQS